MIRRLTRLLRRIRSDRRGNVLMIMGFALVPLTFSVGMGVDYARAARLQTRLNAVADAAALAAVTKPMMSKSMSDAAFATVLSWYAQAPGSEGLLTPYYHSGVVTTTSGSYDADDGNIHVTITDTNTSGLNRVAKITWRAASKNMFGSLLGMSSIEIGGTTATNAKTAPNIDFHVLLDTSGSMAFPATSAGITLLRSKTGGCAFACHSTNDGTALDANNNQTDYYGVATSFNIPLRVDEAKRAVTSMMSLATTTSANNNAVYRAALYSFAAADARANNSFRTLKAVTADLASVGTAAGTASTSLYYNNGCPTSSYCNSDTDTAISDAFNRVNTIMPNPGNGTKVAGDTPQEIMFIITDGMRDETRSNGRPEIEFDPAWCTTVKNRGIRIAILYTEFLQSSMDGNGWSQDNVVPYLYKLEPALTACASPGLMYKVTTDDDISTALNKLFLASVTNAYITQ